MAKTPNIDVRSNYNKNYFVNGDMRLAQRGTSFVSPASATYSLDRMIYNKTGAMTHTITQDSTVPTFAEAGYFFQNSLRLNLTTPDDSIAAGDFAQIGQIIEGYNWANLAQKPFTLSFWVMATLPGTYCVSFVNSGSDRSYVAEYTINAPNTPEYKTITVSASPSAGTWNYTNGSGLRVRWALACGSTFQTTANTWQTGNFFATANQVNGVATGANDFRLTGIKIQEGSQATQFTLMAEDFEGEVAKAQRYFEKTYSLDVAPAAVTTVGAHRTQTGPNGILRGYSIFLVEKRANATPTFYNSSTGAAGQMQLTGTGGVAIGATDSSFHGLSWESAGGIASNTDCFVHWTADAELT